MPSSESEVAVCVHRCPYCHTAAAPARYAVVCQLCLARHHGECWSEAGRCSSCGSDRPLRGEPAPASAASARRARRWPWVLLGLCLALAPRLALWLTRGEDVQRFLERHARAGWEVSQIDFWQNAERGHPERAYDQLTLAAPRRLHDGVRLVVVSEGWLEDPGWGRMKPDGSLQSVPHTSPGSVLVPLGSLVVLTDRGDGWLLRR